MPPDAIDRCARSTSFSRSAHRRTPSRTMASSNSARHRNAYARLSSGSGVAVSRQSGPLELEKTLNTKTLAPRTLASRLETLARFLICEEALTKRGQGSYRPLAHESGIREFIRF